MLSLDRYWGGYISGFLTATAIINLAWLAVTLYFEVKRRRTTTTTHMRNF